MGRHVERRRPHRARLTVIAAGATMLATIAIGAAGCSRETVRAVAPSVSVPSRVPTAGSTPSTPAGTPAPRVVKAAYLTRSVPVRLRIGAIGVDSSLMDLGLKSDGTMAVPPKGFPAGWFTGGPTPGELGPAIMVGHIDMNGPGVFYRLRDLKPGDKIAVTRKDGSTPVFRVTRLDRFPKNKFPTALVYGNIDHAGLRLITCGGSFNSKTGHYEDNFVAFADIVAPAR
jgi:hypothetical protein